MAAGTFGVIMSGPAQTYTVSIFIEHIITDLGLSRSLVSSLYSAGTLLGSLALPFWGRQIDRRGPRKMVVVISILFGLACIYMGFVQNAVMLGLGFLLVRMLGQGSLNMVSQTMINQWWIRKRGMVNGISGLFSSLLGMGAFPTLVYVLIAAFEWRMAYAVLGMVLLFLMAPVGYFLFRNRPEDFQLNPDGDSGDTEQETLLKEADNEREENWTLKEAIRTRAFWIFIFSLASFTMFMTGLLFHLVSILDNRGLDPSIASTVFIPLSITAALAHLAGGFVTDRIPMRFLIPMVPLLQAITLVTAHFLDTTASALIFGALLGATIGVSKVVNTVCWASFFGRKNLGSIFGFTEATGVLGAALGPLPFGFVFDATGSYTPVLYTAAALCILISLAGLTIQKPIKKLTPVL